MERRASNKKNQSKLSFSIETREFQFSNGDVYKGEFKVSKEKDSIKLQMDGDGAYYTNDGEFYKGKWLDDQLNDDSAQIYFKNKLKYQGGVKNMKLDGHGTFIFKDGGGVIEGEFSENNSSGCLSLLDRQKHSWQGTEIQQGQQIIFTPIIPYCFNKVEQVRSGENKTEEIQPDQM